MFAKLFSSITESSLWSEPKETRLLFVTLLAKADETGFVEASIPGIARVANLTLEETKQALECLQSPDEYSKNPENEGRRVAVVPGGFVLLNYQDYRSRRNAEERREYMRNYMKDYRAKRALADVNASKPPLAQTETETETETETKEQKKPDLATPKCHSDVLDEFNKAFGLSCRMTKNREKALRARLADPWWAANWRAALERGCKSAFLHGENDRGWKADFEFFIRPDSVTKILEGKYDNAGCELPADQTEQFLRLQRIAIQKGTSSENDVEWRRNNMTQQERDAMRVASIRLETLADPKLHPIERNRLAALYVRTLKNLQEKTNG